MSDERGRHAEPVLPGFRKGHARELGSISRAMPIQKLPKRQFGHNWKFTPARMTLAVTWVESVNVATPGKA
jgi:hypothetical protein